MIARCPHCQKKLEIADDLAGKQVRCANPECQKIFTVPAAAVSATPPPVPKTPPAPTPPSPPVSSVPPSPPPPTPTLLKAPVPPAVTTSATPPPMPNSPLPPQPPAASPQVSPPGVPISPPPQAKISAGLTAMDGSSALNHVIASLGRALSLRKLAFFLLGAIVTLVIFSVLIMLAAQIDDSNTSVFVAFIAFFVAIGLYGVIAGGVVHMAHQEIQGQTIGIMQTVGYCLGRFISFFFGALLMFFLILLIPALFNGLIYWIRDSGDAGSFITALLFLPQLLINLCLVVAMLVTVIVFCAMVIESFGPFRALGRLIHCIRRQTGPLMVQLIMTFFFGGVVFWSLMGLVSAAALPTWYSNGPASPLDSLLEEIIGLDELSLFDESSSDINDAFNLNMQKYGSGSSYGFGSVDDDDDASSRKRGPSDSGDSLRKFAMGLVILLVFAYPFVFLIVSFTGYYEQNRAMPSVVPTAGIPPSLPL